MTGAVDGLGWDAWFALAVIFGMIVALVREIARPDVILLTSLGLLLASGVISPEAAFSGFSNPAVLTVAALFVVATGVQRTNALAAIDRLLLPEKASLPSVIFRLMGSTSFLSAFLNNTPIVAMLMPGIKRWSEHSGISPSRLMIPLSYAAIVGGIVTLIGTSTNLIVSGMLEERGMGAFSLFELSWVGLPAALLVLIYFSLIGYKFLPDREKGDRRLAQNSDAYQFDLRIAPISPYVGKSVEEAGLRNLKTAFLSHIERNGHLIGPVSPDDTLRANDILTFSGDAALIDLLIEKPGLERVAPRVKATNDHETLPLFEAVVSLSSSLVGQTLKSSQFRERFQGAVLAIQRKSERLKGPIGNITIKPGDLLLIEARPDFAQRWNANRDEFYFVSGRHRNKAPLTRKAPLALAIVASMVLVSGFGLVPIVVAAFTAALLMVITGCLRGSTLPQAVDIPLVLVIAAAFGIGQAIDATGLATAIAGYLIFAASDFGVIAVLVCVYIATNIITELITNNAAAVLMVPIAIVAATDLGVDPHAFAVTVAIAASASFLSPIGYQTNLMVMGAGGYRYTDYTKAGWPVSLILLIVTVLVVKWVWL